jgi:hypothetical protein
MYNSSTFFLQYSAFSVAILNSNICSLPIYRPCLPSVSFVVQTVFSPWRRMLNFRPVHLGFVVDECVGIFLTSTLLSELHIHLLSQQLCATSSTSTQDKSLTPLLGLPLLQGFRQVMEFFNVIKSSKRGES